LSAQACYAGRQVLLVFPEECIHGTKFVPNGTPLRPPASILGGRSRLAFHGSYVGSAAQSAEPTFMSGEWGPADCAARNADPVLTKDLVDSDWIKNDKRRRYKILKVYRSDCGDKPTVELRVVLKDGSAQCVYCGPAQTHQL
jgi:hypothetical protein